MARDTLTQLIEGVWLDTEPVSIVGMSLTSTMTVLRLDDGGLLLYSPVPMTPERRAAVEAIGPVTHLYAPNLFHHMWLGGWAEAYPTAKVHAPEGLSKKNPSLRIDRTHSPTPHPQLEKSLVEVQIEGFRLKESVLVHLPSSTLVLADLVHNVGRPEGAWTKFYTKTMGFYDQVALSRVIRMTAFNDKKAARRSVDKVLELPFSRVTVGHGSPIVENGKAVIEAACGWLPTV